MKLNKTVNIPGASMFSTEADIQHPKSFNESIHLEEHKLNISMSIFPPCSDHAEPHICLTVFVDGEQHVVFSGSTKDAHEFFSRFPRN